MKKKISLQEFVKSELFQSAEDSEEWNRYIRLLIHAHIDKFIDISQILEPANQAKDIYIKAFIFSALAHEHLPVTPIFVFGYYELRVDILRLDYVANNQKILGFTKRLLNVLHKEIELLDSGVIKYQVIEHFNSNLINLLQQKLPKRFLKDILGLYFFEPSIKYSGKLGEYDRFMTDKEIANTYKELLESRLTIFVNRLENNQLQFYFYEILRSFCVIKQYSQYYDTTKSLQRINWINKTLIRISDIGEVFDLLGRESDNCAKYLELLRDHPDEETIFWLGLLETKYFESIAKPWIDSYLVGFCESRQSFEEIGAPFEKYLEASQVRLLKKQQSKQRIIDEQREGCKEFFEYIKR